MDKIEIIVSSIVLFMLLSSVAIIPPIIGKKRYWITWWDYVFPFLGMPLWLILLAVGVGDDISTTNFVFEMFFIMILSVMVPWFRYYLAYSKARFIPALSFLITFLPILVTIALRFFVPLLPE